MDTIIEDLRRILNLNASVIPPQELSPPNAMPKVRTSSQNSSMPLSLDPNYVKPEKSKNYGFSILHTVFR